MTLNIASFVKSLLPSMSKSDLESDLELSLEHIEMIQSTYANLEEITKAAKIVDESSNKLIKEFYTELSKFKPKVNLSRTKNFALDTQTLFKNVKTNGDWVLDEISDAVNDVIVSQALTAYKANIIRTVGHFYFVTRYAADFLNYIYTQEAINSKLEFDTEYLLNKKQKEFIVKNMWIYARLIAMYGQDHEAFKKSVDELEEITLPKEKVDEAVSSYKSAQVDIFDNLPQGFVGSPIYSIRLIFAEWEASRYRNLKDKRKLLELRYLHLKLLKEQGHSDINLDKNIQHLQKRITDIDYTLSKIEESAE